MSKKNQFISIIIPSHNESESIMELISNIVNSLDNSEFKDNYEVILVNDGSIDNTEEVAKYICRKFKKILCVNLKMNLSKPYALETGIKLSNGEIIVNIDADLQYSSDDIIKMLRFMKENNADVVNGYRESRRDPIHIKFLSKFYNSVIRTLSGLKLNDFWCGIKIYKKHIFELMDFSGLARFIIFFSYKYNFNIKEIKVDHFERKKGITSYNLFNRVILAFQDVFTLITCVVLNKKIIYQIKILVLAIYVFFISILIFLGNLQSKLFFFIMSTFALLVCLNLIVTSFLKTKEKNNFNYDKNIKSIIKSSE